MKPETKKRASRPSPMETAHPLATLYGEQEEGYRA